MLFESIIDFSGFQKSHFGHRTLEKLNILKLIGSPILDQATSFFYFYNNVNVYILYSSIIFLIYRNVIYLLKIIIYSDWRS